MQREQGALRRGGSDRANVPSPSFSRPCIQEERQVCAQHPQPLLQPVDPHQVPGVHAGAHPHLGLADGGLAARHHRHRERQLQRQPLPGHGYEALQGQDAILGDAILGPCSGAGPCCHLSVLARGSLVAPEPRGGAGEGWLRAPQLGRIPQSRAGQAASAPEQAGA